MILLIDSGNTRLKWRLERQGTGDVIARGNSLLTDPDPLRAVSLPEGGQVTSLAVSTVASEKSRLALLAALECRFSVPVAFYWSERERNGLVNGYEQTHKMGADRWHGMYAAWLNQKQGFAVVDAGSAMTVDYVAPGGRHLGGFILPGLQMMLRSLSSDAARIGFDMEPSVDTRPGLSTSECVNQGMAWLGAALSDRILKDMQSYGLRDVIFTGGDAVRLQRLGLKGCLEPDLVLDGLAQIHREQIGI